MSDQGTCEVCNAKFEYSLIHTGFSDSAYAYCDQCGKTALLDGWKMPAGSKVRIHKIITKEAEDELEPCACGGHFRSEASPRCPTCTAVLSAEKATAWIEKNALGTAVGWRWQKSWTGLYAICIGGSYTKDNWKKK